MTARIDTDAVKRSADLLAVLGWAGRKRDASTNGGEWKGPCPRCGGDDRFSAWPKHPDGARAWCRRCEWSPDVIELVQETHGLEFVEACDFLQGSRQAPSRQVRHATEPQELKASKHQHPGPWTLSREDAALDAVTGKLAAIHGREDCHCPQCDVAPKREKRVRWRLPDGTYAEGLAGRVKLSDFALCGSSNLALTSPGKGVVVVEGEKARGALAERGCVAVGTVTGAWGTPGDEALRALLGRRVILWPDNDDPGRAHMQKIAERLRALGHEDVRMIDWPEAPPAGDAADYPNDDDALRALIAAAVPFEVADERTQVKAQERHERRLKLTPASEIGIKRTRWLMEQRVPLGAITLVAGREGIGKSSAVYAWIADITRGRLAGACFGVPRNIIVCATEDSWGATIVPRLMAAGADLTRVYRLDVVTAEGYGGYLVVPEDTAALEEAICGHDVAAVVLDPLLSRLDAHLDSHRDAEVRQALEPIAGVAERTQAAFLGLLHLNKNTSTDPTTQVMGSRAFVAVARAVLMFARDPEDEEKTLVGLVKANLGPLNVATLRMHIEGGIRVGEDDEGPIFSTRVVWDGEAEISIRDAMTEAAVTGEDRNATSEATEWLLDYLEQEGGSAESAAIRRAASAAGHSDGTLKRARRKVGVTAESRGYPRRTWWHLPGATVGPAVSEITHGESDPTDLIDLTEPTDGSGISGISGAIPPARANRLDDITCSRCPAPLAAYDAFGRPVCGEHAEVALWTV